VIYVPAPDYDDFDPVEYVEEPVEYAGDSSSFQESGSDSFSSEGSESSSNVGAIVGGVIGGVVGLIIVLVVVIAMHRRKSGESEEVKTTNMAANGQLANGNCNNKAAPTLDFDPYITWLKSVEKSMGPVKLTHSKEFSFADVSVTKPIGEGSFGKVAP